MSSPPSPALRSLVFTDLDGTLLDHDTYSWQPAAEVLALCETLGVPVIFATSKTLAEVMELKVETANAHPCVVENGGAAHIPEGYFAGRQSIVFGARYERIRHVLENSPFRDTFAGFGDWRDEDIAGRTGLTLEKARKAGMRESSEPILWKGHAHDLDRFAAWLGEHDLKLLQGGRFYHVLGDVNKTTGLGWLLDAYTDKWGARPATLALGDGPNDVAMLEWADTGVVIPNAKGNNAAPQRGNIVVAKSMGPEGWADEVKKFLVNQGYKGECLT